MTNIDPTTALPQGTPPSEGISSMSALHRRTLLAGATALPLVAINRRPAHAAEFSYKFANNLAPPIRSSPAPTPRRHG